MIRKLRHLLKNKLREIILNFQRHQKIKGTESLYNNTLEWKF